MDRECLSIGLFGSCSGEFKTTWREPIIEELQKRGVILHDNFGQDFTEQEIGRMKQQAEQNVKRLNFSAPEKVIDTVYNPDKGSNWQTQDMFIEQRHFKEDDIIVFAITEDTTGGGSLSESGFSLARLLDIRRQRPMIILVDPKVKKEVHEKDPGGAKVSEQGRKFARAQIENMEHDNIYFAQTREELLDAVISTYEIEKQKRELQRKYNPAYKMRREQLEEEKKAAPMPAFMGLNNKVLAKETPSQDKNIG